MKTIFLEKSYEKLGGKTNPRLFPKKSKLSISLDQQSKVLYNLLLLYVQIEDYRNILKLKFRLVNFTSYKTFSKTKRGLELVSLPHFLHDFGRKILLTLYSIN